MDYVIYLLGCLLIGSSCAWGGLVPGCLGLIGLTLILITVKEFKF
jgi:hypothetical protein